MPHMMDDFPLLLSTLYEQAVALYPDQEIISVETDLSVRRTTYADTDLRIRRLATALSEKLGLGIGDVAGTFAWNNQRHHELYWATANTGRVAHTLNIRLFPEQLAYIVNHGGDRVIFVDPNLVPLVERFAAHLDKIEHYIIMGDSVGETSLPNPITYEDLIADVEPWGAWPILDERSPMMYCYSSGTTGNPKGVAYTQRSTYMHTISNLANYPLAGADNILPVVPMFHAAAWGYPYQAVTKGAKITYPGPDLSPKGIVTLFERERVTFSAGVPTVWVGIQEYLMEHPEADTSSIRAFLVGGSAVPRAMIEWFHENRGITVVQGWGMTETNPIASVSQLKPDMETWDFQRQLDFLETAGMLVPGLEAKIVDDEGTSLPHDGKAFGELLIRGPWIAAEYLNDPRSEESFEDGWLRTGTSARSNPRATSASPTGPKTSSSPVASGSRHSIWNVRWRRIPPCRRRPWSVYATPAGRSVPRGGRQAARRGSDRRGPEGVPRVEGRQVVGTRSDRFRRPAPEDRNRQVRQASRSRQVRGRRARGLTGPPGR